jgi:hypothetical protein
MKGKCIHCSVDLTADNCSARIFQSGKGKCRKCLAIAQSLWISRNREHVILTQRQAYAKNIEKRRTSKRKNARTIRGRYNRLRCILRVDKILESDPLWNFNYYSEIIKDKCCHYCWGTLSPTGHGLDRMDNSRPHTADNVVPCCTFCNDRKGHLFSYDEMMLLAPALREIQKLRATHLYAKEN